MLKNRRKTGRKSTQYRNRGGRPRHVTHRRPSAATDQNGRLELIRPSLSPSSAARPATADKQPPSPQRIHCVFPAIGRFHSRPFHVSAGVSSGPPTTNTTTATSSTAVFFHRHFAAERLVAALVDPVAAIPLTGTPIAVTLSRLFQPVSVRCAAGTVTWFRGWLLFLCVSVGAVGRLRERIG